MANYVKDRNYQWFAEEYITANTSYDYKDLYNSMSQWFSSDEVIKFLENFMDDRSIELTITDEDANWYNLCPSL